MHILYTFCPPHPPKDLRKGKEKSLDIILKEATNLSG